VSPDHTMKTCCMCGEAKPATREYFSPRLKNTDGLEGRCKVCNAGRRRAAIKTNPEREKATQKRYRERNHEYWLERTRKWREENTEQVKEYGRRYYDEHAEHARKYSRDWYHDNRERSIQSNRDWNKRNPESNRVRINNRRARKLALPDSLTSDDWQHAVGYFGGCCAACGRPPGLWHKLAADHWVPITASNCPGTVAWNIVPLCHGTDGCNNSKKNRDATEWLITRFGPRKGRAILRTIESFLNSCIPVEGSK
jgi:hypothetical protein